MSTEMSEDVIRLREELSEQYRSLQDLKELGQNMDLILAVLLLTSKSCAMVILSIFSCY